MRQQDRKESVEYQETWIAEKLGGRGEFGCVSSVCIYGIFQLEFSECEGA